MREIALTQGHLTVVDDEDYKSLSKSSWHVLTTKLYAARTMYGENKKSHVVYMHREIMGLTFGDPRHIDHINRDTLDNRRKNLRITTNRQNHENLHHQSKYGVGVYKRKGVNRRKPYVCLVRSPGAAQGEKKRFLGCWATPEEAQEARREFLASIGEKPLE